MKTVRNLALLALCSVLMCSSTGCGGSWGTFIKTGNIGLKINHISGQIDHHVLHAGLNAMVPSGWEILEIPTHRQTYTMVADSAEGAHQGDDSVAVNTASSNTLHVDVSVSYHVQYDPKDKTADQKIFDLYDKYRTQFSTGEFNNFEESVLRPSFRQAISDAFGVKTTNEDLSGDGKRANALYAFKQLNARFNPDSIVIDDVRVRAVSPDDATKAAMFSRLKAQQSLVIATLTQQDQQLVNQKNIESADANAKSAHIVASSLTPRLVKYKHLKDLTIVGVPNGAIVNLGKEDQ